MDIYTSLEDKWYDLVDWLDQYIPIAKTVDSIDKIIPSFILVIAFFILVLIGLFSIIFFSGNGIGGVSFEAEVTILSMQGAPVSGAVVSFSQDCSSSEDVSLRTNSEGKTKFNACSDSAYIRVSKEGYSTKTEEVSFEDKKAKIYLSPITSVPRIVNVKVRGESNKIIPEAELYLICEKEGKLDSTLVGDKSQSTVGYMVTIPEGCESIQLKGVAQGYNEKKELLGLKEENKTINLEKIDLTGTVVFEVDSNSGKKEALILVVDELGRRFNLILDSTGVASKTYSPGEYTYTANLFGSSKTGSFTIITNQTTTVEIFFEEVTDEYVAPILNGTAQGVYLKLLDGNTGVRGAEVRLYYTKKGDTNNNYYTELNSNYYGFVDHYPLNDANNRTYYAIITASGYETKIVDVIYKLSGEEAQEIIMKKGGSSLKVNVIDDLNKAVKGAVVSIKKSGFDALFLEPLSTDKNGLVEFKNIPKGEYEIEAKSLTHIGVMDSIEINSDKTITIKIVTGTGNVTFNLINEGKPTNAYSLLFEKTIDGNSLINAELTTKGYLQALLIKAEKKVFLAVDDSNFIYTESPIVTVSRGSQTRDLILYKESDLPNSNNAQMFLEEVYNSNPWISNESKANSLMPGKKYYFLFTLVTKTESLQRAVANLFVSPKDSNTIDSNTKMYLHDAFSVKNSIIKKSSVMNSSIIEQELIDTIIPDKAKQLNVYFGEVSGLIAQPILVEVSIDSNASGQTTLFWEGILGEEKSLLYSKDFVIGEKFCFGKGSCPELLFSNFVRRVDSTSSSNDSNWIPVENYSNLQVGDDYELKVVVENLTDEDFGEIDLVGKIKNTSSEKMIFDNDSNVISSKINLKPFDKNTAVFGLKTIETTPTATIIESIEKGEELKNLKGNNVNLKFNIKNKEDIMIQVTATKTPNLIYSNNYYPYVYVKTNYKVGKVPVKTSWEVRVKGESASLFVQKEKETDENGEWVGALDLTNYDADTVLVFTAIDSNNSNPAYLEITLKKAFNDPVTQTVVDCIITKIGGKDVKEIIKENKHPVIYSKVGSSGGSFTVESTCPDDREVLINSDLGVDPESTFTLKSGETKTVVLNDPASVVAQRGGMLGAYPMQIMQKVDKSKISQIAFIDIIVSSDSSEFTLVDPILDMRKTNSVSSKIINNANPTGVRLDIYYPQMNINTSSVGLTYTKPGIPESIKFNAVVKTHAIEAITHSYIYGSTIKQSNKKDKCRSKTSLVLPEELYFNDLAQNHIDYITDILLDKIESAPILETPDADDRDPTKSLYVLPVPIQNKIRSELNATSGSVSQNANTSKNVEKNELIYFAKKDEDEFDEGLKGNPKKPKKGDVYQIIPNTCGDVELPENFGTCSSGSCSGMVVDEAEHEEELGDGFDEDEDVIFEEGEGEHDYGKSKCIIHYNRVSVNPIPPEGFDSNLCKLGIVINDLSFGETVSEDEYYDYYGEIGDELEEDEFEEDTVKVQREKTLYGVLEDVVDINGDSIWTRVEESVVGRLSVLQASGCSPCKVLYFGDWIGGLFTKGKDEDSWHKVSGGLFGDGGSTARLFVQDEYSHVITYFNERVSTWEKEFEFKPKEGTVTRLEPRYEYKIDSRWPNTDEIIEEDVIDIYSDKQVLLEEIIVTSHGLIPFSAAEGYEIPDVNNTLVEFRNNGLIYAQIPQETIPEGLRVFLKGGYIYAEYIGEDKTQLGNEINFTVSKINLQGVEYAVITVRDWVNGEKVEKIFQVKLMGNPSNCYSPEGIAGLTGNEFSPRLLFDWDWEGITYNQCESTNPNYTYCDATQFTISLFKRLDLINTALMTNNSKVLPEYSSFYAHLIKDGYSADFLSDFDEYYSTTNFSSVGFNTTSDFTGYDSFIRNNKIDFNIKSGETNIKLESFGGLSKGGLYRVEIETILDNSAVGNLFNQGKTNAKINVTFTLVQEAPNYNLFYETPFDGSVGRRMINGVAVFDRDGYGSSLTNDQISITNQGVNSINLVKYEGAPLVSINYSTSNKLEDLLNQIILSYSSDKNGDKKLIFNPMQPTPVVFRIINNNNNNLTNPEKIEAHYKIKGHGETETVNREWSLLSSTMGNTGKCNDFSGREVYSFNEKTNGTEKYFVWDNPTKTGTVELYTTFFTPPLFSDSINVSSQSTSLDLVLGYYETTKLLTVEGSNLTNGNAIHLGYFKSLGYENYNSLQGLFEMISEGKVCISQNSAEEMQIWWNKDYLDTLRELVAYNKSNSCLN